MNISIPTSLTGSVAARLFSSIFLLVIVSQPIAAQAPIGAVEVSSGARGQSSNSSLQQLQEMDAVRREMSELRNLIERQGYEFNQYKRKSDQEILALREQLRALQGGLGDGELNQTDGSASGFSLGSSENVGNLDTPPLNNGVSEVESQTAPEVFDAIDDEPEAAMIGVSVGRYGQPATAPRATAPTNTAATGPLTSPAGSQATSGSGFNDANGGYQQNENANISNRNTNVVAPAGSQAIVTPVTVEVVPAGGSVTSNQASTGQLATGNENLNASNTWEVQDAPNSQSGPVGSNTAGVAPATNQQPSQNNSSELQWRVIQSPGPSSAPLDDAATGSQIDQTGGIQADSLPSQTQPSTDSVLGDL